MRVRKCGEMMVVILYETPILGPGEYTLIAKAVDMAGNSSANSANFIIESLEPPIITDYPKELVGDEILAIKGETKIFRCTNKYLASTRKRRSRKLFSEERRRMENLFLLLRINC